MFDLSSLLTIPGYLILTLLVPAVPGDDEARANFAVTIGILFWLALLLLGWIVISRLRGLYASARTSTLPPKVSILDELHEASRVAQRATEAISWRELWGLAWRAQCVHMGLYLVIPLVWEFLRWVLIIIFIPFALLSFGDRHIGGTDGTLTHLRSPACWTFVGFCAGPRSEFLHRIRVMEDSTCVGRQACLPERSYVDESGGLLLKSLWALLSVAWIGLWRRRLRRRPREPDP